MTEDNYFDIDEEDVLHDAWAMINNDDTEYETIEDVIVGETSFTQSDLDRFREVMEDYDQT